MRNNIYLPTLKHIKIFNYSLYNQDIDYEFIDGVNLIIGGNGVGKTTFINIIKYALIGLYKKDLIVKNYNNEKRYIRESYTNSNYYFRNRTNNLDSDKNGYVELSFNIGECLITVKRGLYNTEIQAASYIEKNKKINILGEVIKQDEYQKYENLSLKEKSKYLQFNYENLVSKKANLADFNDFIFFVNQVLIFDESHNDVLWTAQIQKRIFANYMHDKDLYIKRKNLLLEATYQDSIARHKQEEIKAIKKVQKKIDSIGDIDEIKKKKLKLFEEKDILNNKINILIDKRNNLQRRISELYKDHANINNNINKKEKDLDKEALAINTKFSLGKNAKYDLYRKQIVMNNLCPMCNSMLDKSLIEKLENNKCFLCHSHLYFTEDDVLNTEFESLRLVMKELQNKRNEIENIICSDEKELKKIDDCFNELKRKIFENNTKLRIIENTEVDINSNFKQESAYIVMMNRIEELLEEKKQASDLSEKCRQESEKIMFTLEEALLNDTKTISSIFSEFAEAFLNIPCYLTFIKPKHGEAKIFFPVIDNKIRYDADELSESQRFFVDYSFRMSILEFFYEFPSFYICETPDSSLDISYEENAAKTLLKYIEKPNSLIITSNLNNSSFIKSILKKTKKIKILNLLNYGKVSIVQKNHKELQRLSRQIEEMING